MLSFFPHHQNPILLLFLLLLLLTTAKLRQYILPDRRLNPFYEAASGYSRLYISPTQYAAQHKDYKSHTVRDHLPFNFNRCSHSILFSASTRAATWFLNSIEASQCDTSSKKFFRNMQSGSDKWKVLQKDNFNISGIGLFVKYVGEKGSLLIHPALLQIKEEEVVQLLKNTTVPLFILRGGLIDHFDAFPVSDEGEALKNNNQIKTSSRRHHKLTRQRHKPHHQVERFFERGAKILNKIGREWDTFEYEQHSGGKYILADFAKCYIVNCNFA